MFSSRLGYKSSPHPSTSAFVWSYDFDLIRVSLLCVLSVEFKTKRVANGLFEFRYHLVGCSVCLETLRNKQKL